MLKPKTQLKENRRHRRVAMKCRVEINDSVIGSHIVELQDFSDSGVFLCIDKKHRLAIGSLIQGQVQGLTGDEAPILQMEVVRVEPKGIGLQFINLPPKIH